MHRLKIHSKVKEEKPKFREHESPLFYSVYEFFVHGIFFFMKMSCVTQGWVLWEGSPGLQRVIRDQGDTSALKPVLGGGGGLGADSPSRKDHLSHVT